MGRNDQGIAEFASGRLPHEAFPPAGATVTDEPWTTLGTVESLHAHASHLKGEVR